jgi:hypothetical protein
VSFGSSLLSGLKISGLLGLLLLVLLLLLLETSLRCGSLGYLVRLHGFIKSSRVGLFF